jgi:phosphoglycolate phosphatase/dihydroneopterin aldolase
MRKPAPDLIVIEKLEVQSVIGVPDEERTAPQRLLISLVIEPNISFSALQDRIENTVDYAAVCERVKKVASKRPRKLIETLAEEIATELLGNFSIWRLSVEVRKFILPETEYVAVKIERPVQ